jgi:hypothetical protein
MKKQKLIGKMWQTVFSIIALALAGIPTYIFLVAKGALNPEGFWQTFIVLGVGLWLLGGLQFMLFVGAIVFIAYIWTV